MNKNNPWLGLSSYTEESLKEHRFNGRSGAIAALTSLIRQNLFVTLYGRSGIGKTSLLQAGVFPMLRRAGMMPVVIRLDDLKKGAESAAQVIWKAVSNLLLKEGFRYVPCDEKDAYIPDFTEILVFRKLFSAGRFLGPDDREGVPVVVLDQFEEVLYKAPEASRLLISQLYALIDDNYDLGVSHPRWHDDTNFRIVVSIREDDLFLFEDSIDTLNCVDFKSNRYRLMPLSEIEAKEVILNPLSDRHIFEEGKEEDIADGIIALSKGGGQNVNTLLLSLICYVLYDDCVSHGKTLSASDLPRYNDIIETYYKEVAKDLPKEQRYYIEDHLVDEQGRRTSIYLSDLEKHAPQAKRLIENSSHRLLNENQGRVEFIHDQLAASVAKIRNTRKSRRTRQIGVAALVAVLVAAFLFSFSRLPDATKVDAWNLVNDTEVTSVNINADSFIVYTINDCPFLKSIRLEGKKGYVNVYNCPNLVNVYYPEEYRGVVEIMNCPNMIKDKIIRDDAIYDTLSFKKYKSQYPYNKQVVSNPEEYIRYDSVSGVLVVTRLPMFVDGRQRQKYKVPTCLSDSVKRLTDCYVPYGYKDKFMRLAEYQPFRSINELPVWNNWRANAVGMFGYLQAENTWRLLTYAAILLVQCFFWMIAFGKYNVRYKNVLTVFALSFVYGVGMSLLAVLAFMSFYWMIFNVILPWNQLASVIVGVAGCLACMSVVYKNSFYSWRLYLKNNGIKGLVKDIKAGLIGLPGQMRASFCQLKNEIRGWSVERLKNGVRHTCRRVRENSLKVVICSLLVVVAVTLAYLYFDGKEKRERYLAKLCEMVDYQEYARAYSIIEKLEAKQGNRFYPFFTDALSSIKKSLDGDSISLSHRITTDYINRLAQEHNAPLGITGFDGLLAMTDDASKLAICVEYAKSNDLQSDLRQIVIADLNNQSVDVVTEKSQKWGSDFTGAFSPSGNSFVGRVGSKLYLYSSKDKSTKEVMGGAEYVVRDIVMENDSVYYFTAWGRLYKADAKPDAKPILVNETEDIWSNLRLISPNMIAATGNWSELIIYNILEDSVYFHSKHRYVGDLRNVDLDYAITSKGLFDIRQDSLINENEYLYEYKGGVVELQRHGDLYLLCALEGEEVVEISTAGGIGLNNVRFSEDGNYIVDYSTLQGISIYSITPIAKRDWKISEADKKTFNL